MRTACCSRICALLVLLGLTAGPLYPQPITFNVPAQPAASALRLFARQADRDVQFSPRELQTVRSTALHGRHEPLAALTLLLEDTGWTAREENSGSLVVTAGPAIGPVTLAPIVVKGRRPPPGISAFHEEVPVRAAGNLDLHRTADDVLPFTIYDRERILRSGATDLNDFLQRAMLDGDPTAAPPDPAGGLGAFTAGNRNLNLRGFGANETIVLVNGRRLPEVLTSGLDEAPPPPDVNFIPLSLVQRVEVLPVSSAALYAGDAVGGVINIVLRPHPTTTATEVTATYTNAMAGYSAPQSSVSILHGQSFRRGAVRLRLHASRTESSPPTENDLRYHQRRDVPPPPGAALFRATPNVRSATLEPLFGPATSAFTAVAPGADGLGGAAAFAEREGRRNLDFFDAPGRFAFAHESVDFPFGRDQGRDVLHGAIVADVTSWLQLGLDATFARNVVHRGAGVLQGTLTLDAASPQNPFGQEVIVTLNETAPLLGPTYSEGRIDFSSAVLGALVRLPFDWQLQLDAQYARNVTRYRGLAGADPARWQALVEAGGYLVLRDTQVHGPGARFYDEVLLYRGGRDAFVTLGDYQTIDLALRVTREALRWPTGPGQLHLGVDYRSNALAPYRDELRYGDGEPAAPAIAWGGRSIARYSIFGELQAPLVPESWRLPGIRGLKTNLAARYTAAAAGATNFAPTAGLKLDLAGGVSLRGSVTTSNRFPTPVMSRRSLIAAHEVPGAVIEHTPVFDPVPEERYTVDVIESANPHLRPEAAITQTAGVIVHRGTVHQVRVSLDFIDTRKTGELVFLDAQTVLNLEPVFPERVQRASHAQSAAARVVSVVTGPMNMAWRHSQNWNAAIDYAWTACANGRLELYARALHFSRFDQQVFPNSPVVDQLREPDGAAPGLLQYRANFGAAWFRNGHGFGVDGHYYHASALPVSQWNSQGDDQVDAHSQFDVFVQSDVGRWLPWKDERAGWRAQLRVNNVLGAEFPRYVHAASGAGVQPYGDWRGRVLSLSVTASY